MWLCVMIFTTDDVTLLFKALQFSADKHRDQRRKGEDATPYINHPIEVAMTLWNIGKVYDIPTLAAALLHDTIEDTETTSEEIEQLFGSDVLSIVLEVTDDKSLPKLERKRLQIINAPHKSIQAKQLKLADKACNIRDIIHAPPKDWSRQRCQEYVLWSEKVVAGLRGINPPLEAYYDKFLTQAKQALES